MAESNLLRRASTRSRSFGSDDVIFIKNGVQVASILRGKVDVPFNVEVYNSGVSDDNQHSDLMYLPAHSMDFGDISASIALVVGLSEKRFNELYQDIKLGAFPKVMRFSYFESFTDLPTGLSVPGRAPDSPLYWDLDAVKRLPVWGVSFQYGDTYELECERREEKVEIENNKRQEFFNELNLLKIKLDDLQESLRSIEAMSSSQISNAISVRNILIMIAALQLLLMAFNKY